MFVVDYDFGASCYQALVAWNKQVDELTDKNILIDKPSYWKL